MNIVHNVRTFAALAATIGVAAIAASPVSAQGYYHHFNGARQAQYRQAARLNHAATVEASRGHFRKAAALHRRADALRAAARHGY